MQIWLLVVFFLNSTGPCNQYSLIENEEKRSAGYITHISNDIPISDEILNETWYRVISDNGEKMPTYPPGILHCGTINPIWLNGECSVVS